jgi:hypothetical protein
LCSVVLSLCLGETTVATPQVVRAATGPLRRKISQNPELLASPDMKTRARVPVPFILADMRGFYYSLPEAQEEPCMSTSSAPETLPDALAETRLSEEHGAANRLWNPDLYLD